MLMNEFCDPSSKSMLVDIDWFPAHIDDTAVFSKTSVRCWTEDDDGEWKTGVLRLLSPTSTALTDVLLCLDMCWSVRDLSFSHKLVWCFLLHLRHVKRKWQSVTLWLPKQLKQPFLLNHIITFLPIYIVCAFKWRMWLLTIDTRFGVRISVVSRILIYLELFCCVTSRFWYGSSVKRCSWCYHIERVMISCLLYVHFLGYCFT